jgi:hypothetical protein
MYVLSGADGTGLHSFPGGDVGTVVSITPTLDVFLCGNPGYSNSGRFILGGGSFRYGDVNSFFGTSVDVIGEIDTTPGDEFLVGAPGMFGSLGGYVELHSSDGTWLRLDGAQVNEGFGQSVTGLGDLDGDFYLDYAIGSPLYNYGSPFAVIDAGKVTLYSGRTHAVLDTLVGGSGFGLFGQAIDDAGDMDQDGVSDIIVGAPGQSSDQGAAHVYSGADRSLLFSIPGTTALERMGQSVAGLGDVNGDGIVDVAAGCPDCSQTGIQAGKVTVYSGNGVLLREIFGQGTGSHLGRSVAGRNGLQWRRARRPRDHCS